MTYKVDRAFKPGRQSHNHPAEVGAATAAKIVAEVKRKAAGNIFKPASAIMEQVWGVNVTVKMCIVVVTISFSRSKLEFSENV